MPEMKLKGVTLMNRYNYLTEKHGEAGLKKVLARLPPELASALSFPKSFDWYPLRQVIAVDKAIVDTLFGGDPREAWQLGMDSLERDVKTIYRILLRVLETQYVLSRSAHVWSKLADQGTMVIEKTGPKSADVHLTGFDPVDEIFCHVSRGGMMGVLKACGETAKVEHVACKLKGAPDCLFKATW